MEEVVGLDMHQENEFLFDLDDFLYSKKILYGCSVDSFYSFLLWVEWGCTSDLGFWNLKMA